MKTHQFYQKNVNENNNLLLENENSLKLLNLTTIH